MRPGIEPPSRSEAVDQLDQLRGLLAEPQPPPSGWPSRLRDPLESIRLDDDPDASPALRRLGMMLEVWDCLEADSPEAAEPLPAFFDEALRRLASGLRQGSPRDESDWILAESEARWGDYLSLIDPSIGSECPPPPPTDDEAETDGEPAIDAAELLRRLSGLSSASPALDPTPAAEPAPPVEPSPPEPNGSLSLGGDSPDAEDGPALDGTERLRRLISPASPGSPPAPAPAPESEAPWWDRALAAGPLPEPPEPKGDDPIAEARALQLDPELRAILIADIADLLGRIQELVLGLDGGGGDVARLHELGRCYHTLKGAAGSAGLTALAARIHALEDALEAADGPPAEPLVRRMEQMLSTIEGVLGALDGVDPLADPAGTTGEQAGGAPEGASPEGDEEAPAPASPAGASGAAAPEPDGLIRMPSSRFEELVDLCSELLTKRRAWAGQADRMKQLASSARGCSHRLRSSVDRLSEAVPPETGPAGDELSVLVRRMSEQAEDLAALSASAREAVIPMATEAEDLARLSLRLWEGLQSVRIVPVRGLFQRLIRVARDAARVEGRSVEVELIGEDTGADRSMLDKAYEPLLHLVRNAVGHGIEPPEERSRAGKTETGRIVLEAHREGNTLVLSVRDDGRGLDHEAIAAKARRLGLIGPDEHPSADRLNALIFHPGFSTRSQANAVSGRGVGMDVVAREVEQLRGRIELTTQAGRGTRMTITLPARIALEPVMVVRVRGQAFALPTSGIESVHRADRVDAGGGGALPRVAIGDRRLPLSDLGALLGFSGPVWESCPTVLVVGPADEAVALRVDGIDGPLELVLKPLGPLLAGHPAISGAGLSPAGEVIPALDIAGLLRLGREGAEPPTVVGPDPSASRPAALVVDDSLSVRRIASRHLRALGFEVDEASDGEEALGRLRLRSYRLVMTDLEMPRMDGFALLAELSRTAVPGSPGVVVTSTLTDEATRRRVAGLGAMAFVPKPLDPEQLAAAVGPLLAAPQPAAG
ncbi:hybrid sensor histidine kinase/response regulator [Tautonia sociabilis]|uniref:histidine kinase n=1 Tax=Tautonia sociabilis TaxID=2080755 RepID=A0A432MCR3_9BACT|nr:response regulator [Tautonia sociabilis]RUL82001.1 hybrid sensor histidine kinase/response regulator [Tautonia sociabilis]